MRNARQMCKDIKHREKEEELYFSDLENEGKVVVPLLKTLCEAIEDKVFTGRSFIERMRTARQRKKGEALVTNRATYPVDDKSFETCRISNTLDCTEDNNIYTNDIPEIADNEMALDDKFETDSKEEDE
ncbi:uncharacterized protein LOC113682195 [Pocillopora damicornis]|uniref:uncharacterized protein LOC113682195 n=1 Tax=Pocillopora damicornis TaxID=46731 RepID=UPI000F5580C4|nr:uncharacterized protein LOC113682195 [Pocillopora damicornis]